MELVSFVSDGVLESTKVSIGAACLGAYGVVVNGIHGVVGATGLGVVPFSSSFALVDAIFELMPIAWDIVLESAVFGAYGTVVHRENDAVAVAA